MAKLIVLSGELITQLTESYRNNARYKGSNKTIFEILQQEFIRENRWITIGKSKEGHELFSQDILLRFCYEEKGTVLRVTQWEPLTMEQYIAAILKAENMEGPFDFATDEEADALKRDTRRKNGIEKNGKNSDDKKVESGNQKKPSKFKAFEKQWDDLDLLKQYEMKEYEEKMKRSLHPFSKLDIDYSRSELLLSIKETDYFFSEGDVLFLCTKNDYEDSSCKLPTVKRWEIGKFKAYKYGKKKILIETTMEILNELTNHPELKQGYVYFQDKGYISKQNKEAKALDKLYQKDTVNLRMKDFLTDIHLAAKEQKELNEDLFSPKFKTLDEKQKEAIRGSLKAEDIYFIQGPPGTGKTTVICEIISYLIKAGNRVLLSSQTNLAVDNVLQKIGDAEGVKAIRIGKEERFECGSEKFSLDNRVMHLQTKMIDETLDKNRKMEEIIKQNPLDPSIYRLHQNVLDITGFLRLLKIEEENYQKELKDRENNLKTSDENHKNLQEIINAIDYLRNGKEGVLGRIKEVAIQFGYNKETLQENYRIYQATILSPEEEAELVSFEETSKIASVAKKSEESLEEEKMHLQNRKLGWIEKLNGLNDEIRTIHWNQKSIPDAVVKLKTLKADYERNLQTLQELEKDLEIKTEELECIREKNTPLYEKVLDHSRCIQPLIDRKKESLMEILHTGFMTKSRLLDLFRKSRAFRAQFPVPEEDFHLITRLEDFEKSKIHLLNLLQLEENINEMQGQISAIKGRLVEVENKKKITMSHEDFIAYLERYLLNEEEIDLEMEEMRCKYFLKDYETMERKINLHEKTKALKEDWIKALNTPQQCLRDIYIRISNLICATCIGIASSEDNEFINSSFDYVIIDEAARASSSELLVPLIRGKTMVLVGDHEQINPEIERSILERMEREENVDRKTLEEIYNKSLFGKLYEESPKEMKTFLNKQHRMHSGISRIVSNYFYHGELEDGQEVFKKRHGLKNLQGNSLIFVNTPKNKNYDELPENTSFRNVGEVETVISILRYLDRELDEEKTVGIITPYKPQVRDLIEKIPKDLKHLRVEVKTIDAFQGQEKEIILLSLVRNNEDGRVGHLGEKSRVNVAFSRAQELLVVIGHSTFFKKSTRAGKISSIIQELEKGGKVYEAAYFA